MYRKVLKQDSNEEVVFLFSVSEGLSQLKFSALDSVTGLDLLFEAISGLFTDCWATNAKRITVTSCSKEWWKNKCRTVLETYRWTGKWLDWSSFCSTTRQAKRQFFDNRIVLKLKAVDSKLFLFSFHFYYIFNLSSFLFLELGLGWPDHIVIHQSYQMTWSQVMRHIEGYRRF